MVKYAALILCVLSLTGCPSSASKDRPHYGANTTINTNVNGPTPYWSYVNIEGQKATYAVSFANFAWTNGVNFQLQGSATKLVKITRIRVGPSRSTDGGVQVVGVGFYTSAATGGTPIILTANRQFDTTDPQATAVLTFFSSPAGFGSGRSTFRQGELSSGISPAVGNELDWNFCGYGPERCPTLRGTSEYIIISFNATVAGQAGDLDLDWTEE